MRIEIDYDRCIASGACVTACPQVFGQDDAGIVVLSTATPRIELRTAVADAVAACPAACIEVRARDES